jgi:hypothetical protein
MPELTVSSVIERDIDLLLLEELVASPSFLSWFLSQVDFPPNGTLVAAARSVSTSTGESDLELTVQLGSSLARLLIENKIGAQLQPRQAERYAERAATYLKEGLCHSVTTVLVAPAGYQRSGSLGFDRLISYESILAWFDVAAELGDRGLFKRKLLDLALHPPAWERTTDTVMTAFRHGYWQLAELVAPELGLEAPGPVPAGSFFVNFPMPPGVQLIHKIPYGNVDLQFSGMGNRLQEFVERFSLGLPPGATLQPAGRSAVIRIAVPPVARDTPSDAAESEIRLALDAAIQLRRWYYEANGRAGAT